jgi:hypothetical protein
MRDHERTDQGRDRGAARRGGRAGARQLLIALAAALAACASGLHTAPLASQQIHPEDLPPTGFGTLKVDDIALLFSTQDVRVRVLPLDERVIRLLAPDSYESFSGLKRLKAAEVEAAARSFGITDPTPLLITFFGLKERAPFTPEEITVQSRGRFFRPFAFVPMSPRWGERQVDLRESVVAIALFEPGIALFDDQLVVSYGNVTTSAWSTIARVLDRERSAVLSRAAAAGKQ